MGQSAFTVGIIGGGPAGIYGAKKLAESGVNVVLFNRDIRPGGLAEYGIYHNKNKMKSGLRKTFSKILSMPQVHYRGNVSVGSGGDISLEELDSLGFDAVLWATGAQGVKWAGVRGGEAKGVYDAKELVYHYNRLPGFSERSMPLGSELVIVGAGNVAVDITHWAVEKGVERVTWLVRRGPNQVRYTPKELAAIGGHIDPEEMSAELRRMAPSLRNIGEDPDETRERMLASFGNRRLEGSKTLVTLRFASQVNEVIADESGSVSSLRIVENRLEKKNDRIRSIPDGDSLSIPAQSLVFCVGDAIDSEVGLSLNQCGGYALEEQDDGTFYSLEGRPGWFAAGWARVASDGLVGKARKDAHIAAEHLLSWLEHRKEGISSAESMLARVDALLSSKGNSVVDWASFEEIRTVEKRIAEEKQLDDFRFSTQEELLNSLK